VKLKKERKIFCQEGIKEISENNSDHLEKEENNLKRRKFVGNQVKIVLKLWDEKPSKQCFGMSLELFEYITAWVHEFTELGVWFAIKKVTHFPKEKINVQLPIPTDTYYSESQLLSHIITALCTVSVYSHKGFNELVSPCEYEDILFRKKMIC
jgi:hypothetical protein